MTCGLDEVNPAHESKRIKLDLGCGPHPREGFEGVDVLDYEQRHVLNLVATEPLGNGSLHAAFALWPWESGSVEEVYSSHFVEHITGEERIHFFNELYRVLADKATATIVTPNWSHSCAYGDPTHKWPPMSGWYPLYLNKEWRTANAPHVGYTCDFDWTIAGSWDQKINARNQEFKTFAMNNYIDNWRDLIVTLTKR